MSTFNRAQEKAVFCVQFIQLNHIHTNIIAIWSINIDEYLLNCIPVLKNSLISFDYYVCPLSREWILSIHPRLFSFERYFLSPIFLQFIYVALTASNLFHNIMKLQHHDYNEEIISLVVAINWWLICLMENFLLFAFLTMIFSEHKIHSITLVSALI